MPRAKTVASGKGKKKAAVKAAPKTARAGAKSGIKTGGGTGPGRFTLPVPLEVANGLYKPDYNTNLKAPCPPRASAVCETAGPGKFISALITFQAYGGNTPIYDVGSFTLEIDSRVFITYTTSAATNLNLNAPNNYGITISRSADGVMTTVSIGFPYPLVFKNKLVVRGAAGGEELSQVTVSVLYGK